MSPTTKSEAAALLASGQAQTDFCSVNAWYDDGECDTFCPEPDADCAVPDGDEPVVCALFLEASDGRCGRTADDPCRSQDPDCDSGNSSEPAVYDCDESGIACDLFVMCPAGQVPTRNGDCYGPCVPADQCAPGSTPQCPNSCPVILICQLCDDGSCASAEVACNPDGSCGDVTFVCSDEPEPPEPTTPPTCVDDGTASGLAACPAPPQCPQECAVIAICQLCDDGSCASPEVACNPDGSCGDVTFVCEDGSGYDPCAGQPEGASCTLCAPNDPDCFETAVVKECRNGSCVAAL